MLNLIFLCVCYSVYMLTECVCACLLPGYYILYELCRICPCSHFQTSVSVFRLEVLRCSRPVPPILQTTVDPSSDKASLCVCMCVCRPPCLCQRSPRVEICVCVFSFSGPSGVNLSWRTSKAAILDRIPGFWVQLQPLALRWCRLSQIEPRW